MYLTRPHLLRSSLAHPTVVGQAGQTIAVVTGTVRALLSAVVVTHRRLMMITMTVEARHAATARVAMTTAVVLLHHVTSMTIAIGMGFRLPAEVPLTISAPPVLAMTQTHTSLVDPLRAATTTRTSTVMAVLRTKLAHRPLVVAVDGPAPLPAVLPTRATILLAVATRSLIRINQVKGMLYPFIDTFCQMEGE